MVAAVTLEILTAKVLPIRDHILPQKLGQRRTAKIGAKIGAEAENLVRIVIVF